MNVKLFLTLTVGILIATTLFSQTTHEIDPSTSKAWVDGTSTLKDWTATVKNMSGTVTVDDEGQITAVNLTFDATTMDGGRGADMDKKIYKALKTTEHPNIVFVGGPVSKEGGEMMSQGEVSIAGKKKTVQVKATGSISEGIKGSHPLKFSEFEIEPPSALFGQIVCYDDLMLGFELSFK